jgi:dienelactone hydrolase
MALYDLDYSDGSTALRGYLACGDGTQKRPGIIVAPEAPGLTEHAKRRVRMLSDLGYVAMGVDLYGNGRFAANMEETMSLLGNLRSDVQAWRSRMTAALTALGRHERVDAARMAAIGYCFGGSSVIELARSGADLKAVVCFHGELQKTATPSSAIKAKVLVCQAADDFFTPRDHVSAFQDEMTAANVDWQINIYGGSKHGFTNSESDHAGMPMLGYNSTADRRSWQATQEFLAESLRP